MDGTRMSTRDTLPRHLVDADLQDGDERNERTNGTAAQLCETGFAWVLVCGRWRIIEYDEPVPTAREQFEETCREYDRRMAELMPQWVRNFPDG